MVSWQTAKALLFTLGPLLIPRLLSYYRQIRTQAQTSPVPVRPAPAYVSHALNILFIAAVLAAFSTLPYFSPENIWTLIPTRLQTPTDVIFTRLATLRPGNTLTEFDNALRLRIASIDGRCLYFTYGPSALANCPFCNSDDPTSFLYYVLPDILFPHVLNLCAIGLATSSAISGKEGSRWRTLAVLVGAIIALLDIYMFNSHDWKANARHARTNDLQFFYWQMRTARGLIIALIDAGLAGLLWASSTNRIFVTPASSAERIEAVTKLIEATRGKLGAVGIVRNVVVRDEGLRKKWEAYWKEEGEIMAEIMDEKEVIDGMRGALESGRIHVGMIEEEARKFADGIIGDPVIVPA